MIRIVLISLVWLAASASAARAQTPAELAATCGRAMDADPKFADLIIKEAEKKIRDTVRVEQVTKDQCTVFQHQEVEDQIATNKRHVIIAYIAIWLISAGLLLYMWRRQLALRGEIDQLRRDLEVAVKDGAP